MLPADLESAPRVAEHDVGFVEAPVFGRPEAAAAKQLAIPYAGSAHAKERAKPYLAALGASHVFDLGETFGAALATKLAGNFMIISAARTFAEALEMAEHAGADPALVVAMMRATLFSSPIYKSYGQRLVDRQPSFVSKIPAKDLGLFVATAKARDADRGSASHTRVAAKRRLSTALEQPRAIGGLGWGRARCVVAELEEQCEVEVELRRWVGNR